MMRLRLKLRRAYRSRTSNSVKEQFCLRRSPSLFHICELSFSQGFRGGSQLFTGNFWKISCLSRKILVNAALPVLMPFRMCCSEPTASGAISQVAALILREALAS